MGFEVMNAPYVFGNYLVGVAGFKDGRDKTCGRRTHFDEECRPLWFSGGYKFVRDDDARFEEQPFMIFDHFDDGGLSGGERNLPKWIVSQDYNSSICLSRSARGSRDLSSEQKDIANAFVSRFIEAHGAVEEKISDNAQFCNVAVKEQVIAPDWIVLTSNDFTEWTLSIIELNETRRALKDFNYESYCQLHEQDTVDLSLDERVLPTLRFPANLSAFEFQPEEKNADENVIGWMRFIGSQMRKYGILMKLIMQATDVMIELNIAEKDLFTSLLCGQHSLIPITREFVTLEHELFPWILAPQNHEHNLTDFNPFKSMPSDLQASSCLLLNTTEVKHEDELNFFPALDENTSPLDCTYTSSIWKLWNRFRSKEGSKGFVTSAGSNQMDYLLTLLRGVRAVTDVQIEVFHYGDDDLKPSDQELLLKEFGHRKVFLRDIHDYVDQRVLQAKGWDAKPFVTLFANASEVAYLDSDVSFFQNPEVFFEQEIFKCRGAQFFLDRLSTSRWAKLPEVLDAVAPVASEERQSTRLVQLGYVTWEMESGVVVVDKSSRFLGLLGACRLLDHFPRRKTYSDDFHLIGDKDHWWLGFEMMQEPYMFSHYAGGAVGTKNDKGQTCGRLFHADDYGRPLWMNGGYKYSEDNEKSYPDDPWIRLEYYDDGGHRSEFKDGLPEWEVKPWTLMCIKPSKRGPRVLPRKYREHIRPYPAIFRDLYEQHHH
eukprot:TRINITY_DN24891_c0_g6_i1.p1 TRINITY_DN24891_c0_g6~~TRINITY_DN24891_c0_g6_i1.p1  ORF type:complete len:712 (-),score=159.77 TRINITY_DN24891_c0_g6_i1:93-2228(-)